MSFTVLDMPQRSPEWYQARCGRLTGSRAADMLASIKSGEAAARRDLRLQLVCERLTGQPQDDGYINAAMARGIDCEPLARAAYEALTGAVVSQVGFVAHESLAAGCSPDGALEGFTGLLSLKCPKSATHLAYLRAGVMPPAYVPQMLHELWITGAEWYAFLSWDGRFPTPLQTFHIRTEISDGNLRLLLVDYDRQARAFLAEVDREVEVIQTLLDLPGTLAAAIG